MGRKDVITALRVGRLVALTYMANGRTYTTRYCYEIVEMSPHRSAMYATLGPAAHLHPQGARVGLDIRQHCDDLTLVQPEDGGIR